MARKEGKPNDMFMNFTDVSVTTDASNSTTLVEGKVNTGLSIRGALIWLVHMIECYMPIKELIGTTAHGMLVALSTRQGLVTMPNIGDDGVLSKFYQVYKLSTQGATELHSPLVNSYLPPIPLATPILSVYAASDVDIASLREALIPMRLGFTTAPLDAAAYTEIAEAWGW